jgi:hypothetical protein
LSLDVAVLTEINADGSRYHMVIVGHDAIADIKQVDDRIINAPLLRIEL